MSSFAYLWFYEWHLFGAVRAGQHTPGRYDFDWEVSEREAEMHSDVFQIKARASEDHADLDLSITNRTRQR